MPKTTYVWDEVSDSVIEEYEGNVLSVSYTHEPGLYGNLLSQNRSGVTSYYHYDGRGDTVALTDDSGNVTDTKEYDAWGNVIQASGVTQTPYQFIGRQSTFSFNIIRISCLRGSYYLPSVGRWMSTADDVGTRASISRYATDPSEHDELESKCTQVLMATMAGWKLLGNHCAFDMMKASFSGVPATCPESCERSLRALGFDYISFCAGESFSKFGECGQSNSLRFHTDGSHDQPLPGLPKLNSPSSDIAFAFGKFRWSADGYCDWNCEPNTTDSDPLNRTCCPCAGICGYNVLIEDEYDFKKPPAQPPLYPQESPLYCASILYARNRLHLVNVRCSLGLVNRQKIKGHRCDWCPTLRSNDREIVSRDRPHDPTTEGTRCPRTNIDKNGKVVFDPSGKIHI